MSKTKKIYMVLPCMNGGGAERVASLLLNQIRKSGYQCEFLLTSSKSVSVIRTDLDNDIPITSLCDNPPYQNAIKKLSLKVLRIISSVLCKPFDILNINTPSFFANLSFLSEYYFEIKTFRKKFQSEQDSVVISFLQPSVPICLLALNKLKNKLIISERGDPVRLMKKRYGYNFVKKYYQRADKVVFQTEDAKKVYPENISVKGTVIFNPLKSDLPRPYIGERNKTITTFCRISKQKNLPMLIDAFAIFHKDHKDYKLKIIGDTANKDDEEALKTVNEHIKNNNIEDVVEFLPFSSNVHNEIISDAMYINSSDYEGMSNAMLEAMAIGMPVICTDCPIGGAKAVIENNINGILVNVGDSEGLAKAMVNIADNDDFSKKLSIEASKIKEKLSLENIAEKWMELIK